MGIVQIDTMLFIKKVLLSGQASCYSSQMRYFPLCKWVALGCGKVFPSFLSLLHPFLQGLFLLSRMFSWAVCSHYSSPFDTIAGKRRWWREYYLVKYFLNFKENNVLCSKRHNKPCMRQWCGETFVCKFLTFQLLPLIHGVAAAWYIISFSSDFFNSPFASSQSKFCCQRGQKGSFSFQILSFAISTQISW